MERIIKFRGKPVIGPEEWVYGSLVTDPVNVLIMPEGINGAWHRVYPATVGQFTGATDKDGNEVYEGDHDSDGNEVVWCEDCHGFQFAPSGLNDDGYAGACLNCEYSIDFADMIVRFKSV